jgi:hypothetical protein
MPAKLQQNAEYKETEAGKAAEKRYKQSDAGKAANKRYEQSDKGKAAAKRYDQSDKRKAVVKRYDQSDAGKARDKRYDQSDKGKAAAKRHIDKRNLRYRADPAMRMDRAIMRLAHSILSGSVQTSPTFLHRTSFQSELEFAAVVEATFEEGMSWENHGEGWELEHKIPREAYNFSSKLDRKRCWSKTNVRAAWSRDNQEKDIKLIDDLILTVDRACWPKRWKRKIPTERKKRLFYKEAKAEKEQPVDVLGTENPDNLSVHARLGPVDFDDSDEEEDEEEDGGEDGDEEEDEEDDEEEDGGEDDYASSECSGVSDDEDEEKEAEAGPSQQPVESDYEEEEEEDYD